MMKGHYLNDSNYYVGILPDGSKYFCSNEHDYIEEYEYQQKRKEEKEES